MGRNCLRLICLLWPPKLTPVLRPLRDRGGSGSVIVVGAGEIVFPQGNRCPQDRLTLITSSLNLQPICHESGKLA